MNELTSTMIDNSLISSTALKFIEPAVPTRFEFNINGQSMLTLTKDGFYVRGKRVNQDDKEAEVVYNAFISMLSYHTLTKG